MARLLISKNCSVKSVVALYLLVLYSLFVAYTQLSFITDYQQLIFSTGAKHKHKRPHYTAVSKRSSNNSNLITFIPLDFSDNLAYPLPYETGKEPAIFLLHDSVFLDTRAVQFSGEPLIQMVGAWKMANETAWWLQPGALNCAVKYTNPISTTFSNNNDDYYDDDHERVLVLKSPIEVVYAEHPGKFYAVVLMYCKVYPQEEAELTLAGGDWQITLVPNQQIELKGGAANGYSTIWLPVNNLPPKSSSSDSGDGIAICVAPTRSDIYDDYLLYWTQYYRYMGVSSVIVYDHQIPQTSKTFQSFTTNPMFKTYKWLLPRDQQWAETVSGLIEDYTECTAWGWWKRKEVNDRQSLIGCGVSLYRRLQMNGAYIDSFKIHYYAQAAALYHCLQKTINKYNWAAQLDFDEYIVFKNTSWTFPTYLQQFNPLAGVVVLQSSFYFPSKDSSYLASIKKILEEYCAPTTVTDEMIPKVLAYSSHKNQTFRHGDRSKYFYRPDGLFALMIHYPAVLVGTERQLGDIAKGKAAFGVHHGDSQSVLIHHVRANAGQEGFVENDQMRQLAVKILANKNFC